MAKWGGYYPGVVDLTKEYIETTSDVIPSIAGLAIHVGVARSTIHKWLREDDKEEFSVICEKLLSEQEKRLISEGLRGTFNPTITKLMLTKHGYTDKSETDVTSGGKPITSAELHVPRNDSTAEDIQPDQEN